MYIKVYISIYLYIFTFIFFKHVNGCTGDLIEDCLELFEMHGG